MTTPHNLPDPLTKLDLLVTMPLKIFMDQYVPLLRDKNPSIFNNAWIRNVAGNTTTEVVLLDDKGNPIDVVPQLRVTPDISLLSRPAIAGFIEQRTNISPTLGDAAFDDILARIDTIQIDKVRELEDRWKEFIIRRGIPIKVGASSNKGGSVEVLDINDDW